MKHAQINRRRGATRERIAIAIYGLLASAFLLVSLYRPPAARSAALVRGQTEFLRIEVAPIEGIPSNDMVQLGVVVLDLTVDKQGSAEHVELVRGQSPFIAVSRLSVTEWRFAQNNYARAHVNATFLYKPQISLPSAPYSFEIPLPEPRSRPLSPFPTHVIDPGYPWDALHGGTVIVQLGLGSKGQVQQVGVIAGTPALTEATVSAVRLWNFYIPPGLAKLSHTAIAVVHFATPKRGTPSRTSPRPVPAVLDSITTFAVPSGTRGEILIDNPINLAFRYDSSAYTIPYALISAIEFDDANSGGCTLKVTFAGAQQLESAAFQLEDRAGIFVASAVSLHARRTIHFQTTAGFEHSPLDGSR